MIDCPFTDCSGKFELLKGLKTHLVRKHSGDKMYAEELRKIQTNCKQAPEVCSFCSKSYANKYSLKIHSANCKVKHSTNVNATGASEAIVRIDGVCNIQDLQQIVKNTVEQMDLKPTITNNTTIINNNRTYNTQNNTLIASRETIDSLVPITNQYLNRMVGSTFQKAAKDKHVLNDLKHLCYSWITGPLKDSIVVTDHSRGIAHWKDGDQNNKHVKDPKGNALSTKLQQALQPDCFEEYAKFVNDELEDKKTTDIDASLRLLNSMQIVKSLEFKANQDLAANLIKHAKNGSNKILLSDAYKFEKIKNVIQTVYKDQVIPMIIGFPKAVGENWINKVILECNSQATKHACIQIVCVSEDSPNDLEFVVRSDDNKASFTYDCNQFLDFFKTCIADTVGLPEEQFMICLKFMMKTACFNVDEPQVKLNFDRFCEWIAYDRCKERNTDKDQEQFLRILDYESSIVEQISAEISELNKFQTLLPATTQAI
jgi:hypothetical protein